MFKQRNNVFRRLPKARSTRHQVATVKNRLLQLPKRLASNGKAGPAVTTDQYDAGKADHIAAFGENICQTSTIEQWLPTVCNGV